MDIELVNAKGDNLAAPDAAPAAEVPAEIAVALPPAHARPGETRKQTWERLRLEARAAGMTKTLAYQYATKAVDLVWTRPTPPEPVVADPPPPEPDPPPAPEPAAVVPEPPAAVEPPPAAPEPAPVPPGGGLAGLGELPIEWPQLAANAALQAEVAWVQANRLRVCQAGTVDLSRSLGPAPSHAALSWLETSILYPAKFADVAVKAAQGSTDDQEDVRRERLALGDVRTLLAEASSVGGS